MAVISEQTYTADGSQKSFQVVGSVLSDSHVGVWVKDNSLEIPIESRIVTANYDVLGSFVLFNEAPASGDEVRLVLTDNGEGIDSPPNDTTVVAENIDAVVTASSNIDYIKTNSENITTIANVGSEPMKSAIMNIDSEPLKTAVLDAEDNAISAQEAWDSFRERYYGVYELNPLVNPLGGAIKSGDLYFNSTFSEIRISINGTWITIGSDVHGLVTHTEILGVDSQTLLTELSYDLNYVMVYKNGLRLPRSSYQATDGNTILLSTPLLEDDEITVEAFGIFDSSVLPQLLVDIANINDSIILLSTELSDSLLRTGTLEDKVDNLESNIHGIVNTGSKLIDAIEGDTTFDTPSLLYFIDGVLYTTPATSNNSHGLSSGEYRIVGVNATGIVLSNPNTVFTIEEQKSIHELGRIASSDGTTITSVGDSASFSNEFMRNMYARIKNYESSKFYKDTGLVSKNQTNVFEIDVKGGSVNTPNALVVNWNDSVSISAFQIFPIDGVYGIQPELTPIVAQNTNYINEDKAGGAGLDAIPTSHFVCHTIMRSVVTDNFYIEYGHNTYRKLEDAEEEATVNTFLSTQGLEVEELAKVIVQEGNSDGILEIYDVREFRNDKKLSIILPEEVVLNSYSVESYQLPSALDVPMQVEFGASVDNEYISMDSNGTITFKVDSEYHIDFLAHFGRNTSIGECVVISRVLIDDVQFGSSIAFRIDTNNNISPFSMSEKLSFNAGQTLKFELYRDSAGINDGGLFAIIPTIASWNTASTAGIKITVHN